MHFLTYREHLSAGDENAISILRRAENEFLLKHLHPFSLSILGHSEAFANRYRYLCLEHELFVRRHLQDMG